MSNPLETAAKILNEVGYVTGAPTQREGTTFMAFEGPTVLGFIIIFKTLGELLKTWENTADALVRDHQLGLRRSGQKAWNTYLFFVTDSPANHVQRSQLTAIEENLVGTRKIAVANFSSVSDIRLALLPLLPIQAAPLLEAVDIPGEVRMRTTELPKPAVDAYLSNADLGVVLQELEDRS